MSRGKNLTTSTTDFYRNPSKAIGFVKDGGTVYIGYKNLKRPIAVLTGYEKYSNLKKNRKSINRLKVLENYKFRAKNYESGADLQKNVRE